MTENFYNASIDINVINGCVEGKRSSQKELYSFYAPKMYNVCLRYAGNQSDAEDILQDGFVKLFNNLHKFRGEGSFDGWIRRIFVNTAIESIRRNKITKLAINEDVENSTIDTRNSPLEGLLHKDILNTANVLSEGYKTVFNMYAVEGYSHKEIADKLGITESTSKSQFSRAKAILRSVLLNENNATAKLAAG
jgi:RNA polymerase sigma-70 factor (ECF subfamily)